MSQHLPLHLFTQPFLLHPYTYELARAYMHTHGKSTRMHKHTHRYAHVHSHKYIKHTPAFRGGTFPLQSGIPSRSNVSTRCRVREDGGWRGRERCLSCNPNQSSTVRDKTGVCFSSFPAANDNVKKVEIRPTSSAKRQDRSTMNRSVSN